MENFGSRMQRVQSPIIPVIGELINTYPGTISLGQGVVYYGPPEAAIAGVPKFMMNTDNHQYQSVQGIPMLLEAIEKKLQTENGIESTEENAIVVTAGSNMAFMNAILAITQPGDEIILQTPYYFNHEMAITMASCTPVLVETDENYQLRPQAIAAAITPKTRAVVTISPNNPTGVVYPKSALKAVNDLCQNHGIYHISDEAYEYFTYEGAEHVSPGSFPHSTSHTISLFSLSKAYGFASWRIGYMVIPHVLLNPIKKIQDTILICPPVISQYAAVGALRAGRSYCEEKLKAIITRREMMLAALRSLEADGLCTLAPSLGAFYFFINLDTFIESFDFAKMIISDYRVATIPGNTFGLNNGCYLRIAYGAIPDNLLKEAIKHLVAGIQDIMTRSF